MDTTLKVAYILTIIGAINWGLSTMNKNVVHMLVGKRQNGQLVADAPANYTRAEKLVYLIVAIAAIYILMKSWDQLRM